MKQVEIKVEGLIDAQWSQWLDNLTITHREPDQSLLAGEVIDQAALYGLLNKLRDLSLALVSVTVEPVASERAQDGQKKD